ncbi:hypothetical protein [Sphingomonas sp. Leaf22]|uniref:hypothetical protein n=1 Tax=Sphingomonas sp. Leaf22 TaxID=1735687 RepID=UPI0012E1E2DC|nr:hypothetical protein [Sphingomonas sp. Leaf22]
MARSVERSGQDVEQMAQRHANNIAKLEMAYGAITPRNVERFAGNSDGPGKSAQASAAIFNAAYEQMEARARALVLAIDPIAAAQDRFNAEMAEARGLVSAGVLSLDDYVTKLRVEQAALDQVSSAHLRGGQSSGAHRAALQNIGFQLQDFAVQVGSGQSALVAFAQQFPQAASAVSGLGGKMAGVAAFMGGPWGIGMTVAAAALLPLIGKLLETEKTTDDLVKKMKEDAAETAKAAMAKDIYGKSLDGVIEKQKALNAELARERMTQQQVDSGRLNDSRASLTREATGVFQALEDVTKARRELEKARRAAEAASATGTDETGSAQAAYQAAVQNLAKKTQRYQDLAKAALETQTAVRNAETAIAERQVISSLDAGTAATERYEAALGKLRQERAKGVISLKEFEAGVAREKRALDAAQDAARNAGRSTRDPDTATAASVAKMLRGAIPGVHVTSTTGGKHVANSYHYRNQAVDFVPKGGMGSMTKADVRALFESRGIEIAELLGPGDKGHSDHFHVAWKKGKLALDEFSDAARRAQADASALEALTGRYDPLAAAADRYRKTLAEIDRLKPANADSLRVGARDEFQRARASSLGGRIGIDGINAGAGAEQREIDRIEADRKRIAEAAADEAKRRADAIAELIGGQREAIALAEGELSVVAANDNVRRATLSKVQLMIDMTRLGIDVESEQGQVILANQRALDGIASQIERQRAAWETIRGIGGDLVDTVLSPSTWEDWGQGGKRVLDMLKAEFVKLALLNPIRNMLFGENNATISSVIGSLGRLFGGAGAAAATGGSQGFIGPPGNATGTEHWSGGMMLAGEHGREIIEAPRGSRVMTAGETRRLFGSNDNRRTAGPTVNVYADRAVLADEVRGWVADAMTVAATQGAAGGAAMAESESMEAGARRLGSGRWG